MKEDTPSSAGAFSNAKLLRAAVLITNTAGKLPAEEAASLRRIKRLLYDIDRELAS